MTPRNPYIANRGYLSAYEAGWDANTNYIVTGDNLANQDVDVTINATAGKTYLIDAEVFALMESNCQFKVSGPDGQQSTFPCNTTNGSSPHQHLVYAYQATQSGEAQFVITAANALVAVFYSATVATVASQ